MTILRAVAVALGLLVGGCGVTLRVGAVPATTRERSLEVRERSAARCIHGMPGRDSPYREQVEDGHADSILSSELAVFPEEVRRTAAAAGLVPLLTQVLRERAQRRAHGGEASPDILAMRDELSARMFSLQTQLLATEFEVDCVRGLLQDVLSQYDEQETDRQLSLTIASLVTGAVAAIVAGTWDLANSRRDDPGAPNGPLALGIVSGVGTTALGAAVLVRRPRAVVYTHTHNILTPILAGEDPDFIYPTFIFRLLTLPRDEAQPTPRDELVADFREIMDDSVTIEERPIVEELLFGGGGVYDARLLALHQALLQELGAALDSLARDIDMLGSAIDLLLREDYQSSRAATPAAP